MTAMELLQHLSEGKHAERVWQTQQWYLPDEYTPVTRAVKTLIRRGYVWEHYPSMGGTVGINDKGRAALMREGKPT